MPINTGTAIRELEIGPFSGGINTYSDAAMISDDEMVDCVNFDMALDGSLKSRPPWGLMQGTKLVSGGANQDCNQNVIASSTWNGSRFIVYNSNHIGNAYASYLYYVDGPSSGTTVKMGDGIHTHGHRYGDKMYLVPDLGAFSAGKGLKWDLATATGTLVATMPQGYASIVYKDRLWISGRKGVTDETASRLFFSELGDFSLPWPGTNFFDINPGDGDAVNDLAVYQDNILIFKDNATYVLTYDTGPAQAVLQVINTTVGSMGRYCVAAYENSVFVLQYNKVYEMSNYDFTRVSVKIPFEYDTSFPLAPYAVTGQTWKFPMWLRNVGDRLYVRFWNRVYVYHLRLRAWTRFDSLDPNIKYIGPPLEIDNTSSLTKLGFESYAAGSSLAKSIDSSGSGGTQIYLKLLKMEDQYNLTNIENGNITAPTPTVDIQLKYLGKQYDIGVSHRFKRLMHWGVDCFTRRSVTGTLIPFTISFKNTWQDLEPYFWHELNTWAQPLVQIPTVVQTVDASGVGDQTKFIRFPKSVRFRLLQFQVDMETKGNTTDGPAFIYSVTAFVGGKQLVPKAVN